MGEVFLEMGPLMLRVFCILRRAKAKVGVSCVRACVRACVRVCVFIDALFMHLKQDGPEDD